jgi:uncharacterized protein (DUF849 family)
MNTEVIISCAVTGGGDTVAKSAKVPVTPAAIAADCVAAARAGAAIAHVHVRDPATGAASREAALYREVVERVRDSGVEVILNLTTGMGGDWMPGEPDPTRPGPGTDFVGPLARLVHIEELRPPICSLDCGTMNFGEGIFANTPAHLRVMAERIKALGVRPELEVFDLGHVRLARELIRQGLIEEPPLFQVCLGIPWGAPADTRSMQALVDALPPGALWSGFGIGRMQMPMVAQAVLLGGNVRVGLEDNLYLDKGTLASNAALVQRAVEIIERLGASIASPAQARKALRLNPA